MNLMGWGRCQVQLLRTRRQWEEKSREGLYDVSFGTPCWPPHGSGRAPGSGWCHGPCGETGGKDRFLKSR